jgi:hypothetical protein
MKVLGFSLFLILISVIAGKSQDVIPDSFSAFNNKNAYFQYVQDSVKNKYSLEKSTSYYYSTMPALKAFPSEDMAIVKPDPLKNYHLLEKQVIIIHPFGEEAFSDKPFNGQLPLE